MKSGLRNSVANSPAGRGTRGFTIVELLIVVVVIAILAAITIVAYTGIQGRARLASKTSTIETISKKVANQAVFISTGTVTGTSLASAGGDATLNDFGLGSMSQQIVIDTDDELVLDGGDCTNPAIMTKQKLCLGAEVFNGGKFIGHVVYWNDVENTWKIRTFSSDAVTEVNTPGGQVPNALH